MSENPIPALQLLHLENFVKHQLSPDTVPLNPVWDRIATMQFEAETEFDWERMSRYPECKRTINLEGFSFCGLIQQGSAEDTFDDCDYPDCWWRCEHYQPEEKHA